MTQEQTGRSRDHAEMTGTQKQRGKQIQTQTALEDGTDTPTKFVIQLQHAGLGLELSCMS